MDYDLISPEIRNRYTARVQRGVAVLDMEHPTWREGIDVRTLNMISGMDCLLAQVSLHAGWVSPGQWETPYHSGVVHFIGSDVTGAWSLFHGFLWDMEELDDSGDWPWWSAARDQLTNLLRDLWISAITAPTPVAA